MSSNLRERRDSHQAGPAKTPPLAPHPDNQSRRPGPVTALDIEDMTDADHVLMQIFENAFVKKTIAFTNQPILCDATMSAGPFVDPIPFKDHKNIAIGFAAFNDPSTFDTFVWITRRFHIPLFVDNGRIVLDEIEHAHLLISAMLVDM